MISSAKHVAGSGILPLHRRGGFARAKDRVLCPAIWAP